MSRWGEIVVECDNPYCDACESFGPDGFGPHQNGGEINTVLVFKGWRVNTDGKDVCPQCQEESNQREKGDDDGVEYGHPGDRLAGRE